MMKHAVILGSALGAFSYGWLLLEKALGLHDVRLALYPYFLLIALVPTLILWQWGMRRIRLHLTGEITFLRLFQSGLWAVGVWALGAAAGQAIFLNVISPSFLEQAAARAVQSGMSLESVAAAYQFRSYVFQNVLATLSQGVVLAAGFAYFGSRRAEEMRQAAKAVASLKASVPTKKGKRA